ncbi:uncharacterized protein LOC128993647 [Macrosteles quadrilineatus]|uniref:uncharacterized protein LOC128993647 n=1 Tax=Macrosteles quadrilineatus TaxID=74068 RepID=UPI0023E0C287|nr:uncharacterized protein LOC128993647 [Macrosteles quadrilineatus]XP_054273670.1 uncharacterized protein LOC128993647 [Macrosteles quadrilineatus]XP_054273671.1 uncharacterized protein LOC128993647 [Macrosteles quadrilineatus]XP_054273672.1 uncharacterized protein LOC128993647 [Macrosteles quadrilineatus]
MLRSVGGNSILNTTARVLKRIMTNDVAERYSLLGRKKSSFKQLALCKAVLNLVKLQLKEATVKEVDQVIARWLVQAKTRRLRNSSKALAGENVVADENVVVADENVVVTG